MGALTTACEVLITISLILIAFGILSGKLQGPPGRPGDSGKPGEPRQPGPKGTDGKNFTPPPPQARIVQIYRDGHPYHRVPFGSRHHFAVCQSMRDAMPGDKPTLTVSDEDKIE